MLLCEQDLQVAGKLGRSEVVVEQNTFAALLIDYIDECTMRNDARTSGGLSIDGVVRPHGRKLIERANQEMPRVGQFMHFGEIERGGDGIPFRIHAHSQNCYTRGILAKRLYDCVQFIGNHGTYIGAMSVEKSDNGRTALELGE